MSTPPEPVRVLSLDAIDPDHWPNPRGPIDTTSAKFLEPQVLDPSGSRRRVVSAFVVREPGGAYRQHGDPASGYARCVRGLRDRRTG